MKCKPIKEVIFSYGSIFTYGGKGHSECFVRFDARQIWNCADIGDDLVELWRDNVSVRMGKDVFEKYFRGSEEE